MKKEILAIIPARGGSRSVYKKNIKHLYDQPLINYTIKEALNSSYITRVVVSTDDKEIAEVAIKNGAEAPFLQSSETAQFSSSALSAVLNTLENLEKKENYKPDIIVYLQPTSPFRKNHHIDEAIKMLLEDEELDGAFGVQKVEHHPYMVFKKNEEGHMIPFLDVKDRPLRRQELPEMYVTNASVYVTRRKYFDTARDPKPVCPIFEGKVKAVIMDKENSADINEEMDFITAESILKKNESKN